MIIKTKTKTINKKSLIKAMLRTNINSKGISEKIHEIAETLNCLANEKKSDLFGGIGSIVLFLNYYAKYSDNDKFTENSIIIISNIFDRISKGYLYPAFADGLAGLGWLIEHLSQNEFMQVNTNEIIGELDDFLYQFMGEEMKKGNYDYLHNASGIALYFLSRKSNSKSDQYLTEYINLLDEHKEIENNTIKWKFKNLNKDYKRVEQYNLSLSHGMASIVSILSKIYKMGVNKAITFQLLRGSIDYILSNQFDIKNSTSYFPNSVSLEGDKSTSSRLAWCYGDLGIGVSLWNASKAINDKELEKKSIEILLHSSKRRDLIENMVVDAGLCHGAAGIAHIFNRMFINTKIQEFKDAADYWFKETLKMAKFEDGFAGYKIWRTEEQGGWTNDFSFLEGIAGIGLALISAVSDIEPAWDECLLLS